MGGKLHTSAIIFVRNMDMDIVECKVGQSTKLQCLKAILNEIYIVLS